MVNDCAYIGETLTKYFRPEISVLHLKRSRGLWDKTFGLAWKILRTKGDVYHVHYLLQDCYLASILRKRPLIGHAHGSDLTTTLNRFALGRIVNSNLKRCDKILVSTPDLLEPAHKYRADAEYVPNPVDTDLFFPKPLRPREGKLKVLVASEADWTVKGTDIIIQALARQKINVEVSIISYGKDLEKTLLLAKSLRLDVKMLPKIPHQRLNNYYWDSDVVIGQGRFNAGVLGLVSLEAIACGRPAIANVSSKYGAYKVFPMKDANTVERIAAAIEDVSPRLWEAQFKYLQQNHDPNSIAKRVADIYEEVSSKNPGSQK